MKTEKKRKASLEKLKLLHRDNARVPQVGGEKKQTPEEWVIGGAMGGRMMLEKSPAMGIRSNQ